MTGGTFNLPLSTTLMLQSPVDQTSVLDTTLTLAYATGNGTLHINCKCHTLPNYAPAEY